MKKKFLIPAVASGVVCVGCVVWLALYLIGANREEQEMNEGTDSYVSVEITESVEPQLGSEEPEAEVVETKEPESEEAETEEAETEESDSEEPVEETEDTPTEEATKDVLPEPSTDPLSRKIDFAGLQKNKNKDIYAWISVPGTVIDYPVVQHPDEMDYYLNHNLNGSTGYPGCIYTQLINSKDWSDFNTVLYGHNMKNGTYFAGLHKFEKESFFEKTRYIYIYTEDGRTLTYEIFAAHVSGNEHQLLSYSTNTDEGRQGYLSSVFSHTGSNCHFLEDKTISTSDRIITLATCISGQADKRYLVQGVLVDERMQP